MSGRVWAFVRARWELYLWGQIVGQVVIREFIWYVRLYS